MDPAGTDPHMEIDIPQIEVTEPRDIPSSSSRFNSGNRHRLALLIAVMESNSEEVANLLSYDQELVRAAISVKSKTALHVAVTGNRKSDPVVWQLVELMSKEDLVSVKDDDGLTVLHEAAIAGNVEAAEMLIKMNPVLMLMKDNEGHVPLYSAAQYGQKKMFQYLLEEIFRRGDDQEPNPFHDDDTGVDILRLLIVAGFYDIALQVIHRYSKMEYEEKLENESENADAKGKKNVDSDENASANRDARAKRDSPLVALAKQNLAINYWSPFLYSCIIVKSKEIPFDEDSEISQTEEHECSDVSYPQLIARFSSLEFEIPKFFQQKGSIPYLKLKQFRALQLAKCICKKSEGLRFSQVSKTFAEAIHMGIKHGNYDFVSVILEKNPFAIWFSFQPDEEEELNALQAAVMYRQKKIFNLVYTIGNPKSLVSQKWGKRGNNILHLAAKLAPSDRVNTISGAALQMQREIQWFKMVETISRPSFKDERNDEGKTPITMFNEEHKELVKEGENWIKGIANFCTVIATLIATVSFASQITVPGGNNGSDGLPIFLSTSSDKTAFLIFAILNAVSLVSSMASVGVFLSIITARCAPFDFLFYLPARLILGLLSLFASLVCMLAAFSIILFLVLDIHGFVWAASICGAVFLVATGVLVISHYGLLMDTIVCTFGRGMFYISGFKKQDTSS